MVKRWRAGLARPGCLILLVLFGVAGYVAIVVGAVHLRAWRFRDAMVQETRFAENRSNQQIIGRLQALADSLGLPAEAQRVRVQRTERTISIWTAYTDTVDLHLVQRPVRFSPHVERAW